MIRIMLDELQMEELRKSRFLNPDPEVQRRTEIVLLSAHDVSHAKISEIFNCHRNTITNVLRRYQKDGMSGLASLPRAGRHSELTQHIPGILESLNDNPVRSINEACERIKELTGIVRKPSQVRSILRHFGFRRLVSGAMPCPPKKNRKNTRWIKKCS